MANKLIYQVAVGEVPGFYQTCLDSVAHYAKRIGADHIIQTEPILSIVPLRSERSANALRLGYLPIFEKENAFEYLGEYDQILVLDADIFIRNSAPDVFGVSDPAVDFCAVPERDMPLTGAYTEKVAKHSKGQFSNLKDVDWKWNYLGQAEYFNMGMMLLHRSLLNHLHGQTAAEFLRRPEFERFINGQGHWRWSTDQTLLNWWIKRTKVNVQSLDWRWNALFGAVRDVSAAFFIHFFLAAKLPRKGAEIPALIKCL